MTRIHSDKKVIYCNKKFGLITENQLILTNGLAKNEIPFETIQHVKLVKRRNFVYNTVLFLWSVSALIVIYFYFESEKMELYLCLGVAALITLFYSIIHKFYQYKIVIREKDQSIVEVKSNPWHRKSIKEFHSAIVKCMSSKK